MTQKRTEEFIDLYKRLESALRAGFDIDKSDSPLYWAARNHPELKRMRDELDCCREIRNLLSHNPTINGEHAVEPSEAAVEALRRALDRIERPPLALDAGTRCPDVLMCRPDDLVRPALQEMVAKDYSHVPIVEDGRAVGVFSESNLLTLHAMRESVRIGDGTRFRDISDTLPFDTHRELFPFVPHDATVYAVADLFEASDDRGERVGLVLITHSGAPSERLLGIVTAQDVAAAL